MSSTTFVDYSTPIVASWLNDINTFFYSTFSAAPNGPGALAAIGGLSTSTAATTYAPLASPTFTGSPVLPTGTTGTTQSSVDNTTKIATCAFVQSVTSGSGYLAQSQKTNILLTQTAAATVTNTSNATLLDTTTYDDLTEISRPSGVTTFTATYTGTYNFCGTISVTPTGAILIASYVIHKNSGGSIIATYKTSSVAVGASPMIGITLNITAGQKVTFDTMASSAGPFDVVGTAAPFGTTIIPTYLAITRVK